MRKIVLDSRRPWNGNGNGPQWQVLTRMGRRMGMENRKSKNVNENGDGKSGKVEKF